MSGLLSLVSIEYFLLKVKHNEHGLLYYAKSKLQLAPLKAVVCGMFLLKERK
jgi:hypothetical protein